MMRCLKAFSLFCGSLSHVSVSIIVEFHYMVCVLSQELQRELGQVQTLLIQRLSTLDKYEHVLRQINSIGVEKIIDPHSQVQEPDISTENKISLCL